MNLDSASIKALKQYMNAQHGTDDDIGAVVHDLMKAESHRAAIIIGGTMIEDALEAALLLKMRQLTNEERKRLFGPEAPIGSFSSKTRLAYAFEIIDSATRDEVEVIRIMRNACAHSRLSISLERDELKNVCIDLLRHRKIGLGDGKPETLRRRFVTLCFLISDFIHTGRQVKTNEEFQEWIEEQARIAAMAP